VKMTTDALTVFLQDAFPQVADDFLIVTDSEDELVIDMKISEAHLRPGGTVSGPSMFCLADVAFYLAILRQIGPEALTVTTNAHINFMRKPVAENLLGVPRLLKQGRVLVTGDVLIYEKRDTSRQKPVAHAVMTYSIPPQSAIRSEPE